MTYRNKHLCIQAIQSFWQDYGRIHIRIGQLHPEEKSISAALTLPLTPQRPDMRAETPAIRERGATTKRSGTLSAFER